MSAFISVEHLAVVVDDVTLLASTSFNLDRGGALAITGANGTGKSTLLRVLAGLTTPTTGQVQIAAAAVDARMPKFRARVAALIDPPPLARNLTLQEHLAMVATSWGAELLAAEQQSRALFAAFEVPHLVHRFPHELSSGQTQLFHLALTLSRPCDVLLLDEPEHRLDPHRRGLVADLLKQRINDGLTLVMATHSADLAAALTNQKLHIPTDADTDRDTDADVDG